MRGSNENEISAWMFSGGAGNIPTGKSICLDATHRSLRPPPFFDVAGGPELTQSPDRIMFWAVTILIEAEAGKPGGGLESYHRPLGVALFEVPVARSK